MFISINGPTIRRNAVLQMDDPPIRIARTRSDQKPRYAHEVNILGPSRLVYTPHAKQLRCGARLVLECDDVQIVR